MQFADPTNDLAFKKIFGDENHTTILISLLNSILGFKGDEQIVSVTIANPYQVPRIKDLKESILDINAENQRGEKFIVEMQGKDENDFDKRSVYYTSKAYVKQLKRGDNYSSLKKVYFIAFVNFNMFDSKDYLSRHLILNKETMKQDLDGFEFAFIEMKKFNKTINELKTTLDKWIFFIKNARNLTMIPKEFENDAVLKEAFQIANQGMWDEDELDVYEHMIFEEHAERNRMEAEFSKGVKKGIEQMSAKVEQAEEEKQRVELDKQRVEQEKQRVEQEKQRVEQEKQRVEQEKQRAVSDKQKLIEVLKSTGMSEQDIEKHLDS